MELIKKGKTKDVFKIPNGNYLLKFKDTVTGHMSGEYDPGGNTVVGSVAGVASGALKMSAYYFELLKKHGIPTHYVSADLAKNEMTVRTAEAFGKGLEFVVRYRAVGSFIRRFGLYCKEGDELPKVFEVTLKDDAREDPPITGEILAALNLLTPAQYDKIHGETIKICDIVKDDLKNRGLELIDIKIEFGLVDGKIALIDEISPGNMRVYENGKKLDYITLSNLIT
ncbi:MAG: phosphoribosylaminoimidazolesuccinocarboxamide synthase [Treponema sp.]|jgi:phosphoribosylaminoimidazole-succinocarboxamide synthase|nr:phosphoribosylaminoimidazolesuccinocarboxamide synthase [Treponema sp.]